MTPQQLQAKMKQLAAEMEYTSSDMRAFAQVAADERRKGFERGEGPDGERWQALKPATIKRKAGVHTTQKVKRNKQGISGIGNARAKASKSPDSPLIDQGYLMNPTTSSTKTEGRVRLARSRAETVSSAGSISEIHDKGSGNIPQRHHWGIYAKARQRIQAFHKARFRRICRSIFSGIR